MPDATLLGHCECGICNHTTEQECMEKECKCCLNFHLRSGAKDKK